MPGNFGLIDKDTPDDAMTKVSYIDGSVMDLVFSDEFNTEGRSFYPGGTLLERIVLTSWLIGCESIKMIHTGRQSICITGRPVTWNGMQLREKYEANSDPWARYDPAAITTKNGYLYITLSNMSTHGMDYQGGMMSSWNKFCFTGGILEASVSLPGPNDIQCVHPCFSPMHSSWLIFSLKWPVASFVSYVCIIDLSRNLIYLIFKLGDGKSWPSGLRCISRRDVAVLIWFMWCRDSTQPDSEWSTACVRL